MPTLDAFRGGMTAVSREGHVDSENQPGKQEAKIIEPADAHTAVSMAAAAANDDTA